jgi:hypothetical protein
MAEFLLFCFILSSIICSHDFLFCAVASDAVFMDPNFGIGRHDFDKKAISVEELKGFLDQVKAVNNQGHCLFFSWCMPNQYAMFESVLMDKGYKTPHSLTWYKYNQNVKGTDRYTFASELGIIGYFPSRAEASSWLMSKNPMDRHNVKIGPTLKCYWKKEGNEEPLNLYEKPGWVSGDLAAEHLKPGSVIVIPGAGAGGSLVGLLNRGFNIIAFENDPDQWHGVVSRVQALANFCDEARGQGDVAVIADYEPNCEAPNPPLNTMNLMNKLNEATEIAADLKTNVEDLKESLEEEKAENLMLKMKLKESEELSRKVQELQKGASQLEKPEEEVSVLVPPPASPSAIAVPAAVIEPSPAKEPQASPAPDNPEAEK